MQACGVDRVRANRFCGNRFGPLASDLSSPGPAWKPALACPQGETDVATPALRCPAAPVDGGPRCGKGHAADHRADRSVRWPARSRAEEGDARHRRSRDRGRSGARGDQRHRDAHLHRARPDQQAGRRSRQEFHRHGRAGRRRRRGVQQPRRPDDDHARQKGGEGRQAHRQDRLRRPPAHRGARALGWRLRLGEDARRTAVDRDRGADGGLRPPLAVHRLPDL